MKSKHLSCGILILAVIGLVFVSGCIIEKPEQQEEKLSKQSELNLSTPYKTFNYTIKAIKTENITLLKQIITEENRENFEKNSSYRQNIVSGFQMMKETFYTMHEEELPIKIDYDASEYINTSTCKIKYFVGENKYMPQGVGTMLFIEEENRWKLKMD